MIPDQQQKQQLQKYLSRSLKYRETYLEFYDHILSALEVQPDDISFDEASRKIIAEDFGGVAGMRLIENNYQRSVFAEMQKKYFSYAIENVKFPRIILLVIFTLSMYYLLKQPWFTFMEYLVLLMSIRFIPFLLQMVRQLNIHYGTGAPKTSIKSHFFKWLNRSSLGLILFWLLGDHKFFRSADPIQATLACIFMTMFLVIITLHSLNFYKVYKDDLQTSLKSN